MSKAIFEKINYYLDNYNLTKEEIEVIKKYASCIDEVLENSRNRDDEKNKNLTKKAIPVIKYIIGVLENEKEKRVEDISKKYKKIIGKKINELAHSLNIDYDYDADFNDGFYTYIIGDVKFVFYSYTNFIETDTFYEGYHRLWIQAYDEQWEYLEEFKTLINNF